MNKDHGSLPQLVALQAIESPLPLEHTRVEVRAAGLAASVTIHQRFRNPLTEKADLEYLLPLPHEAAVTAFELHCGERIVRAQIEEIEKARRDFESARSQGQRAGLLEGRRPNLFSLQLANLPPGEFIETVITYHQSLAFTDSQAEFVFPMGITPKYHRAGHEEEAEGVDAPIALDTTQVGDVEIIVEADSGVQGAKPHSPTHPLRTTQLSETKFRTELEGAHLPDHDFVLRWGCKEQKIHLPAWHTSEGMFLATFIPPAADPSAPPLPREYVFVLDRSGSMSGGPMQQAVNALRAAMRCLTPQDTFAILLFDDQLEWMCSTQPVSQQNIEQADRLLERVNGRGGTEILPALSAALSLPDDPEHPRLVVFLTDGAVSSEKEALAQVRRKIGNTRLFTFGVGPSVNRAFLDQLAVIGRGQSEFIGLDEDIEETMIRFQDRISFPLLTDLTLQVEGGQVWDVYPPQLPDLYAGCPLELVGRYRADGSLPVDLVVRGDRMGNQVELRARLVETAPDPDLIGRLWAKARTTDLIDQADLGLKTEHKIRGEVIALALEYKLLTRYTAFLAVDRESAADPGKSSMIHIAQPLPEGLEMAAFSPALHAPMPGMICESDLMLELEQPMFLRKTHAAPSAKIAQGRVEKAPAILPMMAEDILRDLSRTQMLNGSWKNDVELTAAALLVFVRRGHTSRKGHYRRQVSRAAEWLAANTTSGFAAFLCALSLRELAEADGAAAPPPVSLPEPEGDLERTAHAVLNGLPDRNLKLKKIEDMDDLRLAVVTGQKGLDVPAGLMKKNLGWFLAGCIKE